jgi:predicted permease
MGPSIYSIPSIVASLYFMGTVYATTMGILYCMSRENMKNARNSGLIVNLLSITLTPLGAYIITLVLHMRQMSAMAALTPKSE